MEMEDIGISKLSEEEIIRYFKPKQHRGLTSMVPNIAARDAAAIERLKRERVILKDPLFLPRWILSLGIISREEYQRIIGERELQKRERMERERVERERQERERQERERQERERQERERQERERVERERQERVRTLLRLERQHIIGQIQILVNSFGLQININEYLEDPDNERYSNIPEYARRIIDEFNRRQNSQIGEQRQGGNKKNKTRCRSKRVINR
jgi:hypothetical protein